MQNKKIIKLTHENVNNLNTIAIQWFLTDKCNYHCTYCDDHIHNGKVPISYSTAEAIKFCQNIIGHARQKGKTTFIEFNGGEVTYYPEFDLIIDSIKDSGGYVGIITNASRPMSWWQNHINSLDSVIMSFHYGQTNLDHFIDVIRCLEKKPQIKIHVNVMMISDQFAECLAAAKKIIKNTLSSVSLQRLLENHTKENDKLYPYSNAEKKEMVEFKNKTYFLRILKKIYQALFFNRAYMPRGKMRKFFDNNSSAPCSTDQLVTLGESKFKGWLCHAGVENLAIYLDGSIRRGQCGEGGIIGYINDSTFNLNLDPIICNKEFCACGFDLLCTKERVST